MALLFTRLARNFVKAGYYPTDDDTLQRIQNLLAPSTNPMRLLDPCCGEGAALADLRAGLQERAGDNPVAIEALGIEFDRERAWHAKTLLDRVIHADVHDVVVKSHSIGLLFLNPPYGFGVSDAENMGAADTDKAERLERTFLKKTGSLLAPGGVLIYIIPFYALDAEIRSYLARHFERVRFFMAPEQQFKQCVIVGIKVRRSGNARKDVLQMLAQAQSGGLMDQWLPKVWDEEPYQVPAAEGEIDFHAVRLDPAQLSDELAKWRGNLLWPGFQARFNQGRAAHRRPLRDMTQWHLALALAAGQVTGRIQSKDGRRIFFIKGDTFKKKERTQTMEVDDKGDVSETVTMLDKFVPVINAIEFTPDHRLGQIVKIS